MLWCIYLHVWWESQCTTDKTTTTERAALTPPPAVPRLQQGWWRRAAPWRPRRSHCWRYHCCGGRYIQSPSHPSNQNPNLHTLVLTSLMKLLDIAIITHQPNNHVVRDIARNYEHQGHNVRQSAETGFILCLLYNYEHCVDCVEEDQLAGRGDCAVLGLNTHLQYFPRLPRQRPLVCSVLLAVQTPLNSSVHEYTATPPLSCYYIVPHRSGHLEVYYYWIWVWSQSGCAGRQVVERDSAQYSLPAAGPQQVSHFVIFPLEMFRCGVMRAPRAQPLTRPVPRYSLQWLKIPAAELIISNQHLGFGSLVSGKWIFTFWVRLAL